MKQAKMLLLDSNRKIGIFREKQAKTGINQQQQKCRASGRAGAEGKIKTKAEGPSFLFLSE